MAKSLSLGASKDKQTNGQAVGRLGRQTNKQTSRQTNTSTAKVLQVLQVASFAAPKTPTQRPGCARLESQMLQMSQQKHLLLDLGAPGTLRSQQVQTPLGTHKQISTELLFTVEICHRTWRHLTTAKLLLIYLMIHKRSVICIFNADDGHQQIQCIKQNDD